MGDRLVKATVIDGIAATEDRDSQNEVLSLDGADINEMTERGYFNDNHGSGFANTLGRITYAKKVFNKNDANDLRQKMYWNRVQKPFLYVKGYLFDDAEHANAKALSSIMREFKKMGTPLDVQMSVEGKVLNRGHNGLLKESLIRNVALTLVPANRNTGAQVVDEKVQKSILNKCAQIGANVEYAEVLMKNLSSEVRSMVNVPGFIEVVDDPEKISIDDIYNRIKEIHSLTKALSIGYGSTGGPQSRVSGSSIANESLDRKPRKVTYKNFKKNKKYIIKSIMNRIIHIDSSIPYDKMVKMSFDLYNKSLEKLRKEK